MKPNASVPAQLANERSIECLAAALECHAGWLASHAVGAAGTRRCTDLANLRENALALAQRLRAQSLAVHRAAAIREVLPLACRSDYDLAIQACDTFVETLEMLDAIAAGVHHLTDSEDFNASEVKHLSEELVLARHGATDHPLDRARATVANIDPSCAFTKTAGSLQ
jgi:hypothetical protein